jgi:hypothetical protein
MPHQRQAVLEKQLADRRLAADPAQQIRLPAFDQRGIEQRLRIDFVAGLRPREQVGYDRIGLGKGQQDRVADDRLAAAQKLRDAAVAAREAAVPYRVDPRQFGLDRGAMLVARRIEEFEFEQVAQPVDLGPEGRGDIAPVGIASSIIARSRK